MLLDVTPLSLGISTKGDLMSVVIPRNTTIPAKKKQVYSTAGDYHSSVEIMVCEGERTRASDNNLLGLFYLRIPPTFRRGHPFYVCFNIDADGILNVSAEEETSGNKNEITITNDKGRLSTQQIMRLIQEADNYKVEDKKYQKKENAINALDDYVYKISDAIEGIDIKGSKLQPEHEMKISGAIAKARILLDASQQTETQVFEDCLNVVKGIVEPILKIA